MKTPVGDVERPLENFIVNPFDTDDFTEVNNNTIVIDKEIVKSMENISDLGEKTVRRLNSLSKQKYQYSNNFEKQCQTSETYD